MSQADIPADILALPVADRIELVARIWDSISDDAAIEMSDEHRQILEERLLAHKKQPNSGTPWEEVKKELRGE